MAVIIAILALLALGLLLALVKALSQNRTLWGEVRDAERPRADLLRAALLLWSPLALLIVLLALAANRLGAGAVALTYRLSTLDEFCAVQGTPGPSVIPCTGMDGVLAPGTVRPAGAPVDIEYFVAERYRQLRHHLLALSAPELARQASDRSALARRLSPLGAFGLPPAPEDDAELVRLKNEVHGLLRSPVPAAANVFDYLRFVSQRDARVQRLRVLTAQLLARREVVNKAAYAALGREQQGRLWLRHHIAHLLAPVPGPPDAATAAVLVRLEGNPQLLSGVQRRVLLALARNEAAVVEILAREANTRIGAAGLYLSLPISRRCTVAAADESLRLRATDFLDDGFAAVDPERFLQSNSGSFPCADLASAVLANAGVSPRLRPLGFRESVRRSIDRWHDDAARASFRRLGKLSLEAGTGVSDASAAGRAMAWIVPSGIHLGRADCGFLHLDNCAANIAREGAEAGYARARADLAQRAQQQAASAAGSIAQTLDQHIALELPNLDAQLEGMRASAHDYAQRLFVVNYLLRLLGWLAVALIALKSFLYVLALELFHTDEDMAIGFDDALPVQGAYRSGRQLTIDRDFPHPLITRKQLSNTDNNVCLAPWPWSSPLTRILRGRYFIFTRGSFLADAEQAVDPNSTPRGMVASAAGGLSIVEWQLQPGERVIFRYRDFYGASDNVQLATEWSFRLSTLLLGKVRFHSASCTGGEGRLLLKADIEEIDQAHIRAVPPERMIAWDRHAKFSIHSGRTLWKTLLNGYTLVRRERPEGSSGLILVSSDDSSSNLGSIRFVRRIFSAIF